MPDTPKPPQVPLGPALRRTPEERERIAELTDADDEAVRAEATKKARPLLEADPEPEDHIAGG